MRVVLRIDPEKSAFRRKGNSPVNGFILASGYAKGTRNTLKYHLNVLINCVDEFYE